MVAQQEQQRRNELVLASNSKTLKNMLEACKSMISDALPKHMTPERMIRVASVAVSRSNILQKCTVESIVKCVMVGSQLGLDVSGVLGSAYMVPFWNNKIKAYEAQLQPGYRGLIDLARRSGQIASIEARVVYEGEFFDYQQGLEPRLVHKPNLDVVDDEQNRQKLRLVYAIARFKDADSEPQVEVMSRAAIDAIRRRSQAFQQYEKQRAEGKDYVTTPWVTDYEEMARKTVVKRLCKYLPLSVEFSNASEIDNVVESGRGMPQFVDGMIVDNSSEVDNQTAPPDGKSGFGFQKPLETQNPKQQERSSGDAGNGAGNDDRGGDDDLPESTLNQDLQSGAATQQTKTVQQTSNAPQQQDRAAQQSPTQQQPQQSNPPQQQGSSADILEIPDHADWSWITEYAAQRTPPEMKLTLLEVKGQMVTLIPKPWGKLEKADKQKLLDKVNAGEIEWKPGKAAQAGPPAS